MKTILCIFIIFNLLINTQVLADEQKTLPIEWLILNPIIHSRLEQPQPKMKLKQEQVEQLILYVKALKQKDVIEIHKLQMLLPKTTLELLFAVQSRGVAIQEAEKMAKYLNTVPQVYKIKNIAQFDENTSHIIGREWHDIDYSGEGMTWQGQKAMYAKYGITNFKTVTNLEKFFPVESRMPYFKKAYGIV
jgi:hypothetical protein